MITLKTLPQAIAQEVFDQVKNHLLTQNKKSLLPNEIRYLGNGCAYRGENGLKCAVGCLIGDDEYTSGIEGMEWASIATGRRILNHKNMIIDLQNAHDTFNKIEDLVIDLKNIAAKYNLNY